MDLSNTDRKELANNEVVGVAVLIAGLRRKLEFQRYCEHRWYALQQICYDVASKTNNDTTSIDLWYKFIC